MRALVEFFYDYRLDILKQLIEHLGLTTISLVLAIAVGVPVALFLTRRQQWSSTIIGLVGIIQTIPSLALLGLVIPLLGIGAIPAIFALFLYALLPIIRNTYSGVLEVDSNIKEAAKGMGLTNSQILRQVEIPLSLPVIFAGVRTAAVINVGVATLAALIGAGGLGEFIFRGISLTNTTMLLAGAIPAAVLALLIDLVLSFFEKNIQKKGIGLFFLILLISILGIYFAQVGMGFGQKKSGQKELVAGFVAEFMQREDGYIGLKKQYNLDLNAKQFESGLMFNALINGDVDVISGYSTDGRIEAENLYLLEDNLSFFPPYHAAALINAETGKEYPQLKKALSILDNRITDEKMAKLNYEVDFKKRLPREVALDFMKNEGLRFDRQGDGQRVVGVGSKSFTENYILAHIFKLVIENYSNLSVDTRIGMASTQVCFEALKLGEIDVYPEYTGTGLQGVLNPGKALVDSLGADKERVYNYVKKEFMERYQLEWLTPLGFNNTWAIMMRAEDVESLDIHSISDLSNYLKENK